MNEIVKSLLCTAVGIALGMAISTTSEPVLIAVTLVAGLIIVILFTLILKVEKDSKNKKAIHEEVISSNGNRQNARITRTENIEDEDRRKKTVNELVLINEEGDVLYTWSLQGKTSLIIGKSTPKEPVDIDLSISAMSQMISKQHAVLNYTNEGWCVDDIDSKNGTRVRKISRNAILDVKLVGSVQVNVGDIIYIASTMLQLR